MTRKIYDWKRFWCPRGGRINLSDGGFLSDPESEYSYYYPQDVKAFNELVNIPCLVLLGEPGIGKTNELRKSSIINQKSLELSDTQVYHDELNQYSDELRFINNVFNDLNFLDAKKKNSPYILFLDSLDECKIRIDTISEILAKELKNNYWPNLFFRITCRTAEWSNYLENALNDIYGEQNVKCYELSPLRRKDVIIALKENSIDEQKFFDEIYLRGVQPLTIKPITLNFITNLFIKNKTLPSSRKEIYERGLELLIDEPNLSRKESKIPRKFSNTHKLITAQRIAAVMLLCNRSSICLRNDNQNNFETDIFIEDLCGKETIGNEEIEITEELVKEILNTGLFVLHSADKLGWFHQTFAEFLTARYLFQKELPEIQLFNLLFQNHNGTVISIPQLNETIGWIVTFRPELFRKIMENDIEVLLLSDVSLQDDSNKESFINLLLKLFAEEKIFDTNYSFKSHYHKLNHSNIENQLRQIINDKSRNIAARNEAIDIAERCMIQGLLEDVWQILNNKSESLKIRINAGVAIKNIGIENFIKKMKGILLSDLTEDSEDELKGICLTALFPNFISYEELFKVLTKRKNPNLFGYYSSFLYEFHLVNSAEQDLITALRWVSRQETKHNLELHGIDDIMNEIMFTAFNFIDNVEILDAYKDAVIHLAKNYDEIVSGKKADAFEKIFANEDSKRRKLIKAIFDSLTNPLKQVELFYYPARHLAFSKDFKWMLEQSFNEVNENKKRAWVTLSRLYFDQFNIDNINALLTFSQNNPIVFEEYGFYLKPIELNSEEAAKEKKRYEKYLKPRDWSEKRNLYKINYRENVIKCLNRLKEGETKVLWELFFYLVYDPEKKSYAIEDNPDIINYPGWKILSNEEKALIIFECKRYLFEIDPQTENWFGEYPNYRPAKAGYKIIRLFINFDFEFINRLPIEILIKWAPTVVSYPEFLTSEQDDYSKKTTHFFYDKIPGEILSLLKRLLDIETKKDEFVRITKKMEYCWDDNINKILYEKVIEEGLLPNCFSSLLQDILEKDYKPAIDFLITKLKHPLPENDQEYRKFIIASKMLIYFSFRKAWSIIWKLMNEFENFGKDLFLSVAYERLINKNFLKDMNEFELADLFIWFEENFPYSEFEKHQGVYRVGPKEEIKYFKNNIMEELKQRGNNEALIAIENIEQKVPQLPWLNYVLYQAKIITRNKKWIPLKSNELLKILENKNKRYIRDENDLVNIISESLNKLEIELQGESLPVKFIWNNKPVTPKSEGDLSDFIKLHLQRDLSQIIVNREVEIRPTAGSVKGENTDLLVQTFSNKSDIVSVIIEVKGSWNKNLKTDIAEQLKKRYLKDNQCRYGIYLIGWFLCKSWDKSGDYRFGDNPKMELEEVKQFFVNQAEELTEEGYHLYSCVLDCRLDKN